MFGSDVITLPRSRLPGFRRRLGVVFQDFRLVDHLSAFDNVALPLRIAGVDESELVQPVSDMLEWVGLAHRAEARPETLSGGEKQRVAIARAVIGRPDMLLADEPTGDLDEQTAAELHVLLRRMHSAHGLTSLIATHNMQLAESCDRVLRLEAGRLRPV